MGKVRDIWDRIVEKLQLDEDSDCWVFTSSPSANGYGRIGIGNNKFVLTHVFMYEAFFGPIAPGEVHDHLCRNRLCCNPFHLEPVTPKENSMRGVSPTVLTVTTDRCKRGHIYSENKYTYPSGTGRCRACNNLSSKISKTRHKEAVKQRRHNNYLLNREERITQQKAYRLVNRAELAEKRRLKQWRKKQEQPFKTKPIKPRLCTKGHLVEGENVAPTSDGRGRCRICRTAINSTRYSRATQNPPITVFGVN